MSLERFDKIYAEFRPRNPEQLKPYVQKYIGRVFTWQAVYPTHDTLEWCMLVVPDDKIDPIKLPFAWVLSSDLKPCKRH